MAPSLSTADQLLLELEAAEQNPVADAPHGLKRRRREERSRLASDDEKQPTAAAAAPAPASEAPPPAVVIEDPFSTQERGSDVWITDDPLIMAAVSTSTLERHQAKQAYLLGDYAGALRLYTAAKQQLTALLHSNCCKPSLLSLIVGSLATISASRVSIHIKLQDLRAAQGDVDCLKAIRPEWWKTLALQARVLVGERRLQEAIDIYKAALQCDASDAERAKLRQKMEDVERKLRHSTRRVDAAVEQQRGGEEEQPRADGGELLQSPSKAPSTLPLPASPSPPTADNAAASPSRVAAPLTVRLSPAVAAADANPPPAPSRPPSPSSAPTSPLSSTPPKPPSQDYSTLPRITVEGVRDLLGCELFHRAEAAVSLVWKLKVIRDESADSKMADDHCGPVVQLLAKCKRPESRRRKRRWADADAQPAEGADEVIARPPALLDVAIQFRGNRVMEWSCSCSSGRGEDAKADAGDKRRYRGDWADNEERDHVDPALVPCRHVGAVLLLVRSKQMAVTPPSTPSAQPPLYLHPSHALPAAVVASMPALQARYEEMTGERLRRLLQANGEKVSGLKEELVERCVEGQVRGTLPHCDHCAGSLYYANGLVLCKGTFNVERKVRVPCHFHAPEEDVPRRPWHNE